MVKRTRQLPAANQQPSAEALGFAFRLHGAGRLDEAATLAHDLLRRHPRLAGAHYLIGLIALSRGDAARALDHLRQARRHGPSTPSLSLALARAHAAAGDLDHAIAHYRETVAAAPTVTEARFGLGAALLQRGAFTDAVAELEHSARLRPEHAETYNNLGSALRELGRLGEAIAAFERAVALRPDYVRALSNLGVALADAGQPARAAETLRRALALAPDNPGALNNLGHALKAQQDHDGAAEIFARLAALRPGDPEPWLNLGLVEQARAAYAAARLAFEQALALRPDDARIQFCLGEAARAEGDAPRAAVAYRRALALDPEDRCGAHLALALIGAEAPPAAAPERYVQELFDGYAARFDRELVDGLNYRAPEILRTLLTPILPADAKLDIVDLGCGTGLGGAAFHDRARRLDGIDLAPRMIEQARARGIYDGLMVGELVATLAAAPAGSYDLALAADVLVYLGDLAALFDQVARALRPGGWFAFTVEHRQDSDAGFILHGAHRYAHGRRYILDQAARAGFACGAIEATATRVDRGHPVPSLAVLLAHNPAARQG